MHRSLLLCLVSLSLLAQARPAPGPRAAFADPAVAPDGSETSIYADNIAREWSCTRGRWTWK